MTVQIIIERELENRIIRNYLKRNNDERRLKDYDRYSIDSLEDLITIERLIHEYDLSIEYKDKEFQEKLKEVIDYLLDCSIG